MQQKRRKLVEGKMPSEFNYFFALSLFINSGLFTMRRFRRTNAVRWGRLARIECSKSMYQFERYARG